MIGVSPHITHVGSRDLNLITLNDPVIPSNMRSLLEYVSKDKGEVLS